MQKAVDREEFKVEKGDVTIIILVAKAKVKLNPAGILSLDNQIIHVIDAIDFLDQCLPNYRDDIQLLFLRGVSHSLLGNNKRAIADFSKVLSVDGRFSKVL